MLGDGRQLIINAPHVAMIPGLVILVLVIGINLLGDGLRDVLDPRLKSGAMSRPVARIDAAPAAERATGLAQPAAAETAPERRPVLSVRGLKTQFRLGRTVYRAVDGVDFEVARGEALGIVGESGSGKSVTALSILGLVPTPPGRIAGGRILFHGPSGRRARGPGGHLRLSRLQAIRGNRIAYIFQDPLTTLNPLLTVGEQVAETIRRHQNLPAAQGEGRGRWSCSTWSRSRSRMPGSAPIPHQLSGRPATGGW